MGAARIQICNGEDDSIGGNIIACRHCSLEAPAVDANDSLPANRRAARQ